MTLYLGVDLGTSSLKVVACTAGGEVVAEHEAELSVHSPRPGWAEGDPGEWSVAVTTGLAAVLAAAPGEVGGLVAGLGVTGQMHGTVLVSAAGEPTRPAVLWPDTRARGLADRWADLPPRVQARLGGPFSPGLTGPVLAWCQGEPGGLDGAARVLLPKDWVRHGLTGTPVAEEVTDRSDAAATLLWDVADDTWSHPTVTALGLRPGLLPPAVASTTVVGTWRGAPVAAGGGDTPVSLLALERAVGGFTAGDLVVNLGTGAQVIDPVAEPPSGEGPPGWHVYADAGSGRYAMVAVLNGGLALSWARERLGLDWAGFAAAATAPPAGQAVFSPFLTDERGAMAPPARQAPGWVGDEDVASRARAAAEAQVFLVRRAAGLLGVAARRVLLVGGGGRDRWVQQLLADALGLPVDRVEVRSAAAVGAAALVAPADWRVSAGVRRVEPAVDARLDAAYRRWLRTCYAE